jgi:tetratricopeptide (TPR) repeat protein
MRSFWLLFFVLVFCGSIAFPQDDDMSVSGEGAYADRLKETLKDMGKVKEANAAFADNYYDIARTQYEEFRYEEAKENLKLALRYNPEHRDAAELLEKVQGLLGERSGKVETFFDWALKEQQVKIQQRKIEMENLIKEGKKLYDDGEYQEAREKFENALQIHRWMPYKMEFPDLKREAESLYDDAKKKA